MVLRLPDSWSNWNLEMLVLMVSPKALAAVDRQLASSCKSGSFRAARPRAQSSTKRKSQSRSSAFASNVGASRLACGCLVAGTGCW